MLKDTHNHLHRLDSDDFRFIVRQITDNTKDLIDQFRRFVVGCAQWKHTEQILVLVAASADLCSPVGRVTSE
jgi:hypothetical protein